MNKKSIALSVAATAVILLLFQTKHFENFEMRAIDTEPLSLRSRQSLAAAGVPTKKELSDDVTKRNQRIEAPVAPTTDSDRFEAITREMGESEEGYSWSENVRAVIAKEIKFSDKKLGSIAGRIVVLRSQGEREGNLVVATRSNSQIGIYSGNLIVVATDPSIGSYLRQKNLKYTVSGNSFFVQQSDFREALKTLAEIKLQYPTVPADPDIIIQRFRAM